jgi:hypothetical protein
MGGLLQIKMYALDFWDYASRHPNNTFYLTKIGCGIAGYPEDEIKPIFADFPSNVLKPRGW